MIADPHNSRKCLVVIVQASEKARVNLLDLAAEPSMMTVTTGKVFFLFIYLFVYSFTTFTNNWSQSNFQNNVLTANIF